MSRKPRVRKHRPDETYSHLLDRSIELTGELQEILFDLKASYPAGNYTARDMFRARNCILCALESLM